MTESFVVNRSVAWLLFLAASLPVRGQQARPPMVRVEYYSIEQGLSDRNVNHFTKDQQGFIWIATFNGLNRFDGYDFLNYDSRPRNKHKIDFNKVHAVLPDRAGRLLISYAAPAKGPLGLLDPLTGRHVVLEPDEGTDFDGGRYYSFFQASDNTIYFLAKTPEKFTVCRYNERKEGFDKVFDLGLPPGMAIRDADFLLAADGTYWFTCIWSGKDGLYVAHADARGQLLGSYNLTVVTTGMEMNQGDLSLIESNGGAIWLSLPGHFLYALDPGASVVFKPHPFLPPGGYFFARDKKGNLLAYQSKPADPANGCFLLNAGGQVLNYSWIFKYQALIDQVFGDDFTQGLMAGTGDGFNNYQLRSERFKTFLDKKRSDQPYGISARGMAKLGKDKLFIATERDGIFELDLKSNAVSRPGDRLPRLALLNQFQYVRNLLAQGDSVLWISGLGGLLKYQYQQDDLRFYKTSADKSDESEMWGMGFGKTGNIWAVRRDGRLLNLDPVSGAFSAYQNKDGSEPLLHKQPSFILIGRDGTIWVGTMVAGLIRIDPEKGESRAYTANPGDPSGFGSNHITCIYEDSGGMLWTGTMESGLHCFDPRRERVTAVYSRENGLLNNSTVGILPDSGSSGTNYWVSTFSGLSYFDTKLKTFRNYTVADGLSHNEFNRFSYFYDPDYSRFYFGGMNGVNAFDQKDTRPTAIDAPLLVSEMMVAGPEDSTIVRREGLVDGASITLPPGSRFLHLRLALGVYHNPGDNQFAYKIEGHGNDWNYLGTNRDLRIDQLPTGTCTLHLRGADDRGNWSSREVALHLVVREFWYKRWWAFLLYALILAAAGFYFHRFQLGRQMAEKEAERLQQLDAFKTRFFTNISHEFRTPLTVILGMVESLKKHFASGNAADHSHAAEMVGRNSRQLLSLVNQLLELSRLESGKLELRLANSDLPAFLRYQLESFHSYAQTRHIQLRFYTEVPELEMAFDQGKIQTILVNLVSNALKFTPEGGRIDLRLTLDEIREEDAANKNAGQPASIRIEVADTGAGIPADKLDRIFDRFYQVDDSNTRKSEGTGIGLALVQELIKLMKGTVAVESRAGSGTRFFITLPFVPPLPGGQSIVMTPAAATTFIEYETEVPDENDEDDQRPLLLVVEDNADVRFFISACVSDDYRVATAENGAAGIQKAIDRIPDIIISDVMMPEKDGLELCETLKNDERTSHIPIVLLTARADVESRMAGLRRGADDYLAKPFEPGELLVRLENLVKLRLRLQQRYAGMSELPAPSQDPDLAPEDAFLGRIRDVVESRLSETEFDMPRLERALGMSRSQVFRKVKALTGASPSVLIRNIRLQKSRELLRNSTLTIAEIAYEVGFSTPAYFSTMFQEAFGKTPSEWRQG